MEKVRQGPGQNKRNCVLPSMNGQSSFCLMASFFYRHWLVWLGRCQFLDSSREFACRDRNLHGGQPDVSRRRSTTSHSTYHYYCAYPGLRQDDFVFLSVSPLFSMQHLCRVWVERKNAIDFDVK
jgi:hypothetical protein